MPKVNLTGRMHSHEKQSIEKPTLALDGPILAHTRSGANYINTHWAEWHKHAVKRNQAPSEIRASAYVGQNEFG